MTLLSELVWSANEGLCLRIAQSDVTRKKASLLWNTDTFNITFHSPQRSSGGMSCSNKEIFVEPEEKMPLQLSSDSGRSKRENIRCFQRSTSNVQLFSQVRQTDGALRLPADIIAADERENVCSNFQEETAAEIVSEKRTNGGVSNHLDIDIMQSAENSLMLRDPGKELNCDNAAERSHCRNGSMQEGKQQKSLGIMCTYGSLQSPGGIQAGNINAAKTDRLVLRDDQVRHKRIPQTPDKGKRKVPFDDSDCSTNAKERDNSSESIESCSSKLMILKPKISSSSGTLMSGEKKRPKRNENGSFCSGPSLKNKSSFFNLISNITSSAAAAIQSTSATPVVHQLPASEREDPHYQPVHPPLTSVGFGSLFNALYQHNIRVSSKIRQTEKAHEECGVKKPELNLTAALLRGPDKSIKETLHVTNNDLILANMHSAGDSMNLVSQNHAGGLQLVSVEENRNAHHPKPQGSQDSPNARSSRSPEWRNGISARSSSSAQNGGGSGFLESIWITRLYQNAPASHPARPVLGSSSDGRSGSAETRSKQG